jgi:2-polyprenyl-3-methyl-5-hydroxy-6-metoxy-1,4-benzoquinol methylase
MKDESIFIDKQDELGLLINEKANQLQRRLIHFDANTLPTEDFFKDYFRKHHLSNRLFFSLQNSAHILYYSIKKSNKKIEEINMVDYGAGLGTLFMLGSLLGLKRIVYNDHLQVWTDNAELICNSLQFPITDYVVGDINTVISYANTHQFKFDIVVSRNVIEHIYSLEDYFTKISQHNSNCIVYSTTTANFHNPATRLQHILIHRSAEKKYYLKQRERLIHEKHPSSTPSQTKELVLRTRGLAMQDFTNAVDTYFTTNKIAPTVNLYSNTCDSENGVWAEHLLPKKVYNSILQKAGFKMEYEPGFWDTQYKNSLKNLFSKILNFVISLLGKRGIIIAPFVKIIAYK